MRSSPRPAITRTIFCAASVGATTIFDGRRTRRVYSLLSRVGSLEPLLLHPEVHHLVTACLGEVYQFGMLFLSAMDPGQGAQQPHFDAGVYPLPREVEAETNVIWALDDFTPDKRGHLDRSRQPPLGRRTPSAAA
jgi:hypothetical protein